MRNLSLSPLRRFLDTVIFTWIWPLAKEAHRRHLKLEDLPVPPKQVSASAPENELILEVKTPWKLFGKVVWHHKGLACASLLSMLLRLAISFAIPVLLGILIQKIGSDQG